MISTERAASDPGISLVEITRFEQIVIDHQKQIYRILLSMVRDADIADTLTQECFLRAYKNFGSFRGESSIATWLIRIAINLAQDHKRNRHWDFWRKLQRTCQLEALNTMSPQRSPEQMLMDDQSVRIVMSAMEYLSKKQKTVFMLRFVEEMSLEAIADTMDLELGTIKTHLFRALETVRRECNKQNNKTHGFGITNDTRKTSSKVF